MSGINWIRAGFGPDFIWQNYPQTPEAGVVAWAVVPPGRLVLFADVFEGQVHTFLDLWVNGKLVATSDDHRTWPEIEKFLPRRDWPASAFPWTAEEGLCLAVKLERWAKQRVLEPVHQAEAA